MNLPCDFHLWVSKGKFEYFIKATVRSIRERQIRRANESYTRSFAQGVTKLFAKLKSGISEIIKLKKISEIEEDELEEDEEISYFPTM